MNSMTLIYRYGKETEGYGIALKRFANVINSIYEKDAIKITKKKNIDIANEVISQFKYLNKENLSLVNICNENNSLGLPQIIRVVFSNLPFSNNVRLEFIKKDYKGKAGAAVRLYIVDTISAEETIIDINKYKEMNFIKDNSLSFVECNCCLTNIAKY